MMHFPLHHKPSLGYHITMKKSRVGIERPAIVLMVVAAVLAVILCTMLWLDSRTTSDGPAEIKVDESSLPDEEMKTGKVDEKFLVPLTWEYPESWTVKSTGGGPVAYGEVVTQTITLTSPSKKFEVVYKVGANNEVKNNCRNESPAKIQHIGTKPIEGLDDAIFVESVTDLYTRADNKPDWIAQGQTYASAIFKTDDSITNAKIDSNDVCAVTLPSGISLSPNVTLLEAKIKLIDVDKVIADDITVSKGNIMWQYENAEYQQAVSILLSTKVETS